MAALGEPPEPPESPGAPAALGEPEVLALGATEPGPEADAFGEGAPGEAVAPGVAVEAPEGRVAVVPPALPLGAVVVRGAAVLALGAAGAGLGAAVVGFGLAVVGFGAGAGAAGRTEGPELPLPNRNPTELPGAGS